MTDTSIAADAADAVSTAAPARPASDGGAGRLVLLSLGALGVVYGDIGTSPIYAFRETLAALGPQRATPSEVIGIISLLIWALMAIVTVKYVSFLLVADNRGEGGVLALYAKVSRKSAQQGLLVALAIAGAAFFFGDAVLTPAISVLSAIEGAALIAPRLSHWVLPLAVGVLGGLFLVQKGGTARISAWFGPITAIWFAVMAVSGAMALPEAPQVLRALSPLPGLEVLAGHGLVGLAVLGAVFLCVTGAEALYADLGHFGRRPIRLAWFFWVMPALILSYLGQGALVLAHPQTAGNPFFLLVSPAARPALVALATAATVIAAQAVISGAFSLGRQALSLGLLPRLEIRHTSDRQMGQIYIPVLNWLMMLGTLMLTVSFGSSSALAGAYGVSVLGSMLVSSVMAVLYLTDVRGRTPLLSMLLLLPILTIELAFGAANLMKIADGGYVPLALAAALMVVMAAWRRGSALAQAKARRTDMPLDGFVRHLSESTITRVPGTAVFLTYDAGLVPSALLHNLKHNQVLHEQIVIVTVRILPVPVVPSEMRMKVDPMAPGVIRARLRFGFMETPNVGRALFEGRRHGLKFDIMMTSFFLGRRRFGVGSRRGLGRVMDRLFVSLSRVAADPALYYHLPRDRVVEIGTRVAL